MLTALHKDILSRIDSSDDVREILSVVEVLLILLKKFGKQLAQSPVKEFVEKNYPEAFALYTLLGGVQLNIADTYDFQQQLYAKLPEDVLRVVITGKQSQLPKDAVVTAAESDDVSLLVQSSSKVYKRSLSSDLNTMLQ